MRNGFTGRGSNLFPRPLPGQPTALGNNLPPVTGWDSHGFHPGPAPAAHMGGQGQLGEFDGVLGADPRAPKQSPDPRSSQTTAWSEGDVGEVSGHPGDRWQSFRRYGLQGFNDQLTAKDRHAYWDTGNQRTGVDGFGPAGSPNAYNSAREFPPAPELRTVNRTVSYQKGSDNTRNQDDLSRQYTWMGEQGSGWTRINGGVPGLYQPYGTRGGVPYPIVSPAPQGGQGDGPHSVWSGPPHGLHSRTPWKGGAQFIRRAMVLPQMRPVRLDRPSNSPQAGQSYSQTVRAQGASRVRPPAGSPVAAQASARFNTGRGWAGRGNQ